MSASHRSSVPGGQHRIAVVAAVNDDAVYRQNLGASRAVTEEASDVRLQRGYSAAGQAYNAALDAIGNCADLVIFAHQDVYFPDTWVSRLRSLVDSLDREAPEWAVLGLFGASINGKLCGRIWSSGLNRELGPDFKGVEEAQSIDEVVIILRTESGCRFDERLPGYHLYGTDLVLTAQAAGRQAFVIANPAVHNSRPVMYLDCAYRSSYRFIQSKWRSRLPVVTTVLPVTRFGWPLIRSQVRGFRRRKLQRTQRPELPKEGRQIALRLGYDQRPELIPSLATTEPGWPNKTCYPRVQMRASLRENCLTSAQAIERVQ